MGPVLLKMLPFALGTIAPTMIGLIVIFLSGTRGLVKASAFILGKYIFYVFWGLIALDFVDQLVSPGLKVPRSVSDGFFLLAGLLLLVLAVRNFFVEDDPDAPPPKFMTVLAKLGHWDISHPTSLYHIRALRRINYCRSQVINDRKFHFSLSTCPAYGMANAYSFNCVSYHG